MFFNASLLSSLKVTVVLIVCFTIAFFSKVYSQTIDSGLNVKNTNKNTKYYSLAKLWQQTLENSFDIRTKKQIVITNKFRQKSSKGFFYPKIDISVKQKHINEFSVVEDGVITDEREDRLDKTVTLSQKIFSLSDWYRYKQADHNVQIALIEKEITKQDTAFNLIDLYLKILQNITQTEVNNLKIKQFKRSLKEADRRLELGNIAKIDVLEAQVELSRIKTDNISLENSFSDLSAQLENLVAKDFQKFKLNNLSVEFKQWQNISSQLMSNLGIELDNKLDKQQKFEYLAGKNLSIQKYLINLNLQRAKVNSAKSNYYPTLNLNASYTQDDVPGTDDVKEISLGIAWNIFNGMGDYYNSASAQADFSSADIDYMKNAFKVQQDFSTSIDNIKLNAKLIQQYSGQIKNRQKLVKSTYIAYFKGLRKISEYLDAQSKLLDLWLSYTTARFEYIRGIANYLKTTSQLNEKNIKLISKLFNSEYFVISLKN